MPTSITLQMDGVYPDIASGSISFRNGRTGTGIEIKAPKDLISGTYAIRSITMDTGAGVTVLPAQFAERLDVERPLPGAEEYYIFGGVGGMSICFRSPDPLVIGIEDGEGKLEKIIKPFFLMRYAPSVTSEGRMLAKNQPYNEGVLPFISPPFQHRDDYTVEIHSPTEKFPLQRRRLKLEVNTGQKMDYILIGRDWQKEFDILFEEEEMIIKERG